MLPVHGVQDDSTRFIKTRCDDGFLDVTGNCDDSDEVISGVGVEDEARLRVHSYAVGSGGCKISSRSARVTIHRGPEKQCPFHDCHACGTQHIVPFAESAQ